MLFLPVPCCSLFTSCSIWCSNGGTFEFQQWNSKVPAVELESTSSGTHPHVKS